MGERFLPGCCATGACHEDKGDCMRGLHAYRKVRGTVWQEADRRYMRLVPS